MSPSPFLTRYLINWLTSRTISYAQSAAMDELKSRLSGEPCASGGDSELPALESDQRQGRDRITVGGYDFGVVAATKRELVGLTDKMKSVRQTKANSYVYWTGTLNGASVAAIETGAEFERAKEGTEALLQAFRPCRVVCLGFATALVSKLKPGRILVPERLLLEDGSSLELSRAIAAQPSAVADALEEQGSAQSAAVEPVAQDDPLDFLTKFSSRPVITTDREKIGPKRGTRYFEELGAYAYDRISRVVGDVCAEEGVPFLPLLAIFNLAESAGSQEAVQIARNSQTAARFLGALFGATLKNPKSAVDLCRVRNEEVEVSDKLARTLALIADALVGNRAVRDARNQE